MKVIICRPQEEATVIEVADLELGTMQGLVGGGLIQLIPLGNGYNLWCNEEGLLRGLQPNRRITDVQGCEHDLTGPFFITKEEESNDPDDEDGPQTVELSELEVLAISRRVSSWPAITTAPTPQWSIHTF